MMLEETLDPNVYSWLGMLPRRCGSHRRIVLFYGGVKASHEVIYQRVFCAAGRGAKDNVGCARRAPIAQSPRFARTREPPPEVRGAPPRIARRVGAGAHRGSEVLDGRSHTDSLCQGPIGAGADDRDNGHGYQP